MLDIPYKDIIDGVNLIAVIMLVFLIGALVAILGRWWALYRRAGWAIPSLLKRNLIFFGGLGGLIIESIILRVVGGDLFTAPSLLRLLFVIHYDIIFVILFGYYLKVEALDMDDPQYKGDKGDKGDKGERGERGEKGDRGDQAA